MSEENKKLYAWHFLAEDWTAHGGFKVKAGKTYKHTGLLEPCISGLHASVRAYDAMQFRKGPVVTFVECSGEVVCSSMGEKFACSKRTALWGYDAAEELLYFARWCALEVADLWNMPAVVREYLETGNEDLKVQARYAADAGRRCVDVTCEAFYASQAASYTASYPYHPARAYAAALAAAFAASHAAYAASHAVRAAAKEKAKLEFISRANEMLESLLYDGAVSRGLTND